MDTRSKNSSFIGILLSILIVALLSGAVMMTYPWINRRMEARSSDESNQEYLGSQLAGYTYALYWRAAQKRGGSMMTPVELYYPDFAAEGNDKPQATFQTEMDAGEYTIVLGTELDHIREQFNAIVSGWYDETQNSNVAYMLRDEKTGEKMTNTAVNLLAAVDEKDGLEKLKDKYGILVAVRFDSQGAMTVQGLLGTGEPLLNSIENWGLDIYFYNLANSLNIENMSYGQLNRPVDLTVIYGVAAEEPSASVIDYDQTYQFSTSGFSMVYTIAMILSALCAVSMSVAKPAGFGQGCMKNAVLEFSVICFMLPLAFYEPIVMAAYGASNGILAARMVAYEQVPELLARVMQQAAAFFSIFCSLMLIYISFVPVGQVINKGLRRFAVENILGIRLIVGLKNWFKRKYESFLSIDLTETGNKKILQIVLVNFFVLLILCSFWFFGILLLICYSAGLFFLLHKYYGDLRLKHQRLLDAAERMADGHLDVEVEEDLGLFNPMKEALMTIQSGFRKAVDEEVKSQRMKTELITNVSHDLKTPLTAIITYVGLLRDEKITEEERNSYIDTLDRKSQRLKRLIEDLFEMSKASSRNITLDIVDMDIVSLLKQIRFELSDRLDASGIDFRFKLPEEKVVVQLDSSKSYRIFENLLVNITKYAMPGSRAYVTMETGEDYVEITMKNMAAEEMEFSGEEVTERFVRGDKSRNTEGSGLGLAIAKNFVELQNGTMEIIVDGDLFKVVIRFPYNGSCLSEEIEV